jgi:hypothetical protein
MRIAHLTLWVRGAKNEKLKLNMIKFSCGFNKILNIELEVIK